MVYINQIRDLINYIHNNAAGIRVEKGGKAPFDRMNMHKIYIGEIELVILGNLRFKVSVNLT